MMAITRAIKKAILKNVLLRSCKLSGSARSDSNDDFGADEGSECTNASHARVSALTCIP